MQVAILGAGLSGMCMGIQLRRAGIESFTIFEKADEVGGTWRENRYPGVACDVPSHLYSFSFALNPHWSRAFAPGREIQQYCERTADRFGLRPHLRFASEITSAEYGDDGWTIRSSRGEIFRADVLVGAMGGLHKPHMPEIPGIRRFQGRHFHSANWPDDVDLGGRRVAVVGSAASAVQIVPEIAEQTERVLVFQRTANWIVPRGDRGYSERTRRLFARFPLLPRLQRWLIYGLLESRLPAFRQGSWLGRLIERGCRRYLAAQVPDAELRERLTPNYRPGCKRVLLSDDFYSTLARADVDLVTAGIERIDETGIVTSDGAHHDVDTIVFATGFEPFNFLAPFQLTGVAGRKLSEVWKEGIEAHRTVAVPGFPNFFMLLGPNSGLGHNSVILMIEAQVRYVLQCVQALRDGRVELLDPIPEASDRFNERIQGELGRTIWKSGCKSWYLDERGKVFTLWPGSTLRYWWEMRRPRFEEYQSSRRLAP